MIAVDQGLPSFLTFESTEWVVDGELDALLDEFDDSMKAKCR